MKDKFNSMCWNPLGTNANEGLQMKTNIWNSREVHWIGSRLFIWGSFSSVSPPSLRSAKWTRINKRPSGEQCRRNAQATPAPNLWRDVKLFLWPLQGHTALLFYSPQCRLCLQPPAFGMSRVPIWYRVKCHWQPQRSL